MAVVSFALSYPLIAIAIWFTVAGLVFSVFEHRHNLRSSHL